MRCGYYKKLLVLSYVFVDNHDFITCWLLYKYQERNEGRWELTNEDAFNVAKSAFSMYGAFFNNVAQEIGVEQALNLHTKTTEMMGVQMGQMTKEQMGISELDAKAAAMVARSVVSGFGISKVDAEEKPTSVLIKVHGCPLYEGYRAVGIDDETIEVLCRKGALKFRSAPDDCCEEEITLRK